MKNIPLATVFVLALFFSSAISSPIVAQQAGAEQSTDHAAQKDRQRPGTERKQKADQQSEVGKNTKQTQPKKKKNKLQSVSVWTDAAKAMAEHPGFKYVGEYQRTFGRSGETEAIQVTVQGNKFYLSIFEGGLPGAGWDGGNVRHAWIESNKIHQRLEGYKKIVRAVTESQTAAPENAIQLFDGTNMDHWAFGKMKGGLMQVNAKTKRAYQDFKLHFEFQIPYKPDRPISHPDRGNSGVFALGCYEVQIADTFGLHLNLQDWQAEKMLKKPNTACGSVYGLRSPNINMCLPPLSWQSLDIDFTAARFDASGKKLSAARITVYQNGVLVHKDFEIPSGTGGGPAGPRKEVAKGPIYFQNHNNPNQFRNVWVVEK